MTIGDGSGAALTASGLLPTFAALFEETSMMIRKVLILVAMLGVLGGCDTPPSREPFPKLTYSYLPPFRLAVGQVSVVDQYHPPLSQPYIEQQFPISPAETAEIGR